MRVNFALLRVGIESFKDDLTQNEWDAFVHVVNTGFDSEISEAKEALRKNPNDEDAKKNLEFFTEQKKKEYHELLAG